jgi:hypothetical protein
MGKRYEIRKIRGVDRKLCRGPLHHEGGAWIPVDRFGIRRETGRLRGNCKACEHLWRYYKPPRKAKFIGTVRVSRMMFAIREIEQRVGRLEAARRVGVSRHTWYSWITGKRENMQKLRAVWLIQTLYQIRREKIIRHRVSIRRGAAARGEAEKVPKTQRDRGAKYKRGLKSKAA